MGRKLAALEEARNAAGLLERIRTGDRAAASELTGVFLCKGERADVEVEIGVPVLVSPGKDSKVPDFRVRRDGEEWTYVEVTSPDAAELQAEAEKILNTLAACLEDMPIHSSIEVFLRRDPSDADVQILKTEVGALSLISGPATKDLEGLALLLANQTPPGQLVMSDHGEPPLPRIGTSRAIAQVFPRDLIAEGRRESRPA